MTAARSLFLSRVYAVVQQTTTDTAADSPQSHRAHPSPLNLNASTAYPNPNPYTWGDTPSSAELRDIAEIERQSLATLNNNRQGAGPLTSLPLRIFFTPTRCTNTITNEEEKRGSSTKKRKRGQGPHAIAPPPPSRLGLPTRPFEREEDEEDGDIEYHHATTTLVEEEEEEDGMLATVKFTPMHTPDEENIPGTDGEEHSPSTLLLSLPTPPRHITAYLPPSVVSPDHHPPTLYPWQAECLCTPGVLQGRNLVYCAPTSGGKTLVGEILLLRQILSTGRPALLVLPFVALCAEKSAHLRKILSPLGKEVREEYGAKGSLPLAHLLSPETGAIVCTIERANTVVNRILEEYGSRNVLSCVVIDELHMVGDEERGYQLELLLTKLRYTTTTTCAEERGGGGGVQIVGMSATLPNLQDVATWLRAALYISTYRPVPLKEYIKHGNAILDSDGQVVRRIAPPPGWPSSQGVRGATATTTTIPNSNKAGGQSTDVDEVGWLAQETLSAGNSVLIFCATRSGCQTTAKQLASVLHVPEVVRKGWSKDAGGDDDDEDEDGYGNGKKTRKENKPGGVESMVLSFLPSPPTRASIVEFLQNRYQEEAAAVPTSSSSTSTTGNAGTQQQQQQTQNTLLDVLIKAISRGIAFHHAGLESEQREAVEIAYKCGAVSVLCATSTLAVGVNLPARRVIFKEPYIAHASCLLTPTRYKQMAGRAGRAGIDDEGESILCIPATRPLNAIIDLVNAPPSPIESCLSESKRGMRRVMAEAVGTGVVSTAEDVDRFIQCTLLAAQLDPGPVVQATQSALKSLCHDRFIMWDAKTQSFKPTPLGKAALGSGLDPEVCAQIRDDVARARDSLVLSTELHLTYLCVPVTEKSYLSKEHQWRRLAMMLQGLGPADASVADKVGIDRTFVYKKAGLSMSGNMLSLAHAKRSAEVDEKERICQRFWTALMLNDVLQERGREYVCREFDVKDNGVLEGLQDRAARYAGMLTAFCERLGWLDLQALLSKFQTRVLYGVRPEVVSLMDIPFVKSFTARVLYKGGLTSPEAVVGAGTAAVAEVLLAHATSLHMMHGKYYSHNSNNQHRRGILAMQMAGRIVRGARRVVAGKADALKREMKAAMAVVEQQEYTHTGAQGGVVGTVLPPIQQPPQ